MDCSENESVCSVKKENCLGYYRLHTIWKTDGFFIHIASKEGAWRGEMTSSDVNKMSKQLNMEPNEYLKQCKTALTSHDGLESMTYAVENGSFVWKKVFDEDSGIKIKMGSVMLQPASFVETIQNLVTAALNCNKKLQKENIILRQEKEKLEMNKLELLQTVEEMIKTKDMMEEDLYSRFILLLNTKKKRISELETHLKDKNKELESQSESEQATEYEYDRDTDDSCKNESDGSVKKSNSNKTLKSQNKERRSPFLGESSKETKVYCNDDMMDNEITAISPKIPKSSEPESKTQKITKEKSLASTKNELLDFFFCVGP